MKGDRAPGKHSRRERSARHARPVVRLHLAKHLRRPVFLLPSLIPVLLVVAALTASATATVGTASNPDDLLITQVYGGGGEPDSTWSSDFVELTNRGDESVDLSGWSLQYADARSAQWSALRLSSTVPPGGHYVIAGTAGRVIGAARLPAADNTRSLTLGTSSGKVALVHATDALRCRTNCTKAKGVRDFVGYGAADDSEGQPAPALSTTTAAVRRDVRASTDGGDADQDGPDGLEATPQPDATADIPRPGGVDTNDNVTDFVATTPTPPPAESAPADQTARIAQIQGRSHVSPLAGQVVAAVPGVVTAVTGSGFWMQDPTPDNDPATSDGLFVYTGTAPEVESGDTVRVAGTVIEHRPGGAHDLSTTELIRPTVAVISGAAGRPVPVVIGPGGRVPPSQVRTDAPGDVETSRLFAPTVNALDFYESLEGMLVRVVDPVVTGPTSATGQLSVLPRGDGSPKTGRGSVRYAASDPNTERVLLDDRLAPLPIADVGDRLPGVVDGVLVYEGGGYQIVVLETPEVTGGGIKPESAASAKPAVLTTASVDVDAVDLTGESVSLRQFGASVVQSLRKPDVLAVAGVPDDSGATNDDTVHAGKGWNALIEAIVAAGGPRYSYRQIDPVDGKDANALSGEGGRANRRIGFLFDPARISFVDRRGSGTPATTSTGITKRLQVTFPLANPIDLSSSPGRIAPADPSFVGVTKSLAGEFLFGGQTVFVIANQFVSDRADDPLLGREQPPRHPTAQQRGSEAAVVSGFVNDLLSADPEANVVVLGGMADVESSPTLAMLTAGGHLVDLTAGLPAADRYSYLEDGNAELADHVLVTPGLADAGSTADAVHAQSEFAVRWTDHDPVVGDLRLPAV